MNKADLADYAAKRAMARGEVRVESDSMKDFANRDIRKNKSNLPGIILGSALIAGTLFAGGKVFADKSNESPLSSECPTNSVRETYQGYRYNKADGTVEYVFDKMGPERNGNPSYVLTGDSSLTEFLEIGKKYCFTTDESILPFLSGELEKISKL